MLKKHIYKTRTFLPTPKHTHNPLFILKMKSSHTNNVDKKSSHINNMYTNNSHKNHYSNNFMIFCMHKSISTKQKYTINACTP